MKRMKIPLLSLNTKIRCMVLAPLGFALLILWISAIILIRNSDQKDTIYQQLNQASKHVRNELLKDLRKPANQLRDTNLDFTDLTTLGSYFGQQLSQQDYLIINAINYARLSGDFVGVTRCKTIAQFLKDQVNCNDKQVIGSYQEQPITTQREFFIIDRQGRWSDSIHQEPRLEVTARPWSDLITPNNELTWTEVYTFDYPKTPGLTAVIPIQNEAGKTLGGLMMDVTLQRWGTILNELTEELKAKQEADNGVGKDDVGQKRNAIWQSGLAFIDLPSNSQQKEHYLVTSVINPEGKYYWEITNLEQFQDATKSAVPNLAIACLAKNFSQLEQSEQIKNGCDQSYHLQQTSLQDLLGLSGNLGVIFPQKALARGAHFNWLRLLWIIAVSLLVAIPAAILGLLSSRRIINAILQLSNVAESVEAHQRLDDHALETVSRREDELGTLAQIFQRMVVKVYEREQQMEATAQTLKAEVERQKQVSRNAPMNETANIQRLIENAQKIRQSP